MNIMLITYFILSIYMCIFIYNGSWIHRKSINLYYTEKLNVFYVYLKKSYINKYGY